MTDWTKRKHHIKLSRHFMDFGQAVCETCYRPVSSRPNPDRPGASIRDHVPGSEPVIR